MRRNISFNPDNFHYKQPAQEAGDRPESPTAGSSLATPGNMAANAAATHEQLAQLNKTVLDDFIQKAEKHLGNTKLTIDYYRDVLEEVADFLATQPQIRSLQDLQRLNCSNPDDRRRVNNLIKEFYARGNAKITLGIKYAKKDKLLKVFDALNQSVAPNASIKLQLSNISRQADRLIHEYASTPLVQAGISEKYLKQYTFDLNHLAKWLDAKRESGQPVSDEENSLEKLGSLEKLRTYSDDESVKKVIEHFCKEKENDPEFPERTKSGIGAAVKSFRKLMGSRESRVSSSSVSVTAPVAAVPAVAMSRIQFQLLRDRDNEQVLPPKNRASRIQVSHQAEKIIDTYKFIMLRGANNYKERGVGTIQGDVFRLKHFARWAERPRESGEEILHGLDNLEKLGSHHDDDEVIDVLTSFKQNSEAPQGIKNGIQGTVNAFRWIWNQIEAELEKKEKLKEEESATEDFETDQFAAELEAELSSASSPYSPQNVALASTTLSEEPLAQPHKSMPEISERQTDAALDHMPQTSEVGSAAIEDQEAPFEPEWGNIPFDPAELSTRLYGFENVPLGDDFFDFMHDEDLEALQADAPAEERPRQSGDTVTSQADVASSSQAGFGTAHPHANPSSSSTAPASLAPPSPGQTEFRRQLLGEVGEAARLKQPAPEPQTGPRSVRPRTAPPLAPPRPRQTALQQQLLAHASSLARPSFPSPPRSRRGTADKDEN